MGVILCSQQHHYALADVTVICKGTAGHLLTFHRCLSSAVPALFLSQPAAVRLQHWLSVWQQQMAAFVAQPCSSAIIQQLQLSLACGYCIAHTPQQHSPICSSKSRCSLPAAMSSLLQRSLCCCTYTCCPVDFRSLVSLVVLQSKSLQAAPRSACQAWVPVGRRGLAQMHGSTAGVPPRTATSSAAQPRLSEWSALPGTRALTWSWLPSLKGESVSSHCASLPDLCMQLLGQCQRRARLERASRVQVPQALMER